MNRKRWGLLLAVMAAAGCNTPNRPDLRQDAMLVRASGSAGKIIEPRRCDLRLAILARPLHEDVLNDGVWRLADEQAVGPEARRTLEANGLRVGLITGDLPSDVEKLLTAPPPDKVEPTQVLLPDGDFTLVKLNESTPQISLLLNSGGSTSGKDYKDARGFIRLTARYDGTTGVSLRFVPEIQHGPVQHTFGAAANAGPFAPQQFVMKDGQQEDTLRELAATLTLQPGQVAVVGCRAERERSLGSFLFTQPEANSDRILQKVLLVWASRGTSGDSSRGSTLLPALEPVEPPDSSDRPDPPVIAPDQAGPKPGPPASAPKASGSPAPA